MHIRPATLADAPAIAAIYTHHILHGTGTFEETAVDAAEMSTRMTRVLSLDWPWLVAEAEGEVLGFAYAAQFRDRSAYRYSGEDSVYVAAAHHGRGVGAALVEALIAASAGAGFRRLFAVIGDSGNHASIALHRRFGFRDAGLLEKAGYKFGRELDVVFMALDLPAV